MSHIGYKNWKLHTFIHYNPHPNLTEIIYYSTKIVSFNNDKIILDTGGHFTPTTKRRINQTSQMFNLDFEVIQKNWQWIVTYKDEKYIFNTDKPLTIQRKEK